MKGRRCMWEWNESIKCFQTPFEDWKPMIDGGKMILGFKNMKILIKIYKIENMNKKLILI